jgi:hypothetical protein
MERAVIEGIIRENARNKSTERFFLKMGNVQNKKTLAKMVRHDQGREKQQATAPG